MFLFLLPTIGKSCLLEAAENRLHHPCLFYETSADNLDEDALCQNTHSILLELSQVQPIQVFVPLWVLRTMGDIHVPHAPQH